MMNGLVHHNTHVKDENNVSVAMHRITLMGPRYTDIKLHSYLLNGACGNPVHAPVLQHT